MKIYRGAQVAPAVHPDNTKALFAAGANLLRYQITTHRDHANAMSEQEFYSFLMNHVNFIKTDVLPHAATYSAKVVVYLHIPAGGYDGNRCAMFTGLKPWGRNAMFNAWQMMATALRDSPQVIGYGILNEPAGSAEQVRGLMKQCVRRIRTVDQEKICIVTCPYSDPAKFTQIQIFQDKKIWYLAHMYYPPALTHQGIAERPYPVTYPYGNLNRDKLEAHLGAMTRLARDKKLTCYIGEFSISNFASDESRVAYLKDCIRIFEERGWHWSYHAWREAPVWDVEPRPSVLKVLTDGWGKNV